jgi:hypothetical protein
VSAPVNVPEEPLNAPPNGHGEPLFAVARGHATPDELAALAAVLLLRTTAEAPAGPLRRGAGWRWPGWESRCPRGWQSR